MRLRLFVAAAFGALGLATSGSALAVRIALPGSDHTFMVKTVEDTMAKVEMGRIAQERSSNVLVRRFATRMVVDDARWATAVRKVADAKGHALPLTLNAEQRAAVIKMQQLPSEDFDRQYMDHMVVEHIQAVAEFEKTSQSKDPEVSSFARDALPTLREHLDMARAAQAAAWGR